MKKIFVAFIAAFLILIGVESAFAASGEIIAAELQRSVDFIISENIEMVQQENSEELRISPLVITNNSNGGLRINKISIEGKSGWRIASGDAIGSLLGLNNKVFSLLTTEGHDFLTPFTGSLDIESGQNYSVNFEGKTSPTSKSMNSQHIADFIVEVEALTYNTVLYEDGTLIINESSEDADGNTNKHGSVVKVYEPLSASKTYVFSSYSAVPWYAERTSIKGVEFGSSVKPTSMAYWFYGCTQLESFDSANLNTSNVTSLKSTFERAGYNVENFALDLKDLKTSNVTSMYYTFRYSGYNSSEWTANLTGWDTSSVTTMEGMFESSGYKASEWTLSGHESWNTSKVTSFASMFKNVGKEKLSAFKLDLSKWNTSLVKTMKSMFELAAYNATKWDIGDISGWQTPSLTNMELMFSHAGPGTSRLHDKDLSKWDTSKVTTMKNLFRSSAAYNIKLTIPRGCNVEGLLDQKATVAATLTFEGIPSSYANAFRRAATSPTYGKVNLITTDSMAAAWFEEMIALYGPAGTSTKGYIYIL